MAEGSPPNPFSTTDKLLGALVTMGLVTGGIAALFLAQSLLDRRDAAMLASIPDVLVTWREGGDLFWPMLLILFGPSALLSGAFGMDKRTATPGARKTRQLLIATAVTSVVTGVAWGAVAGRDEVAVATPFGVSWLYDGKPREYWTWGAATDVGLGCATTTDAKTRETAYELNYDVSVPSGRVAQLVRDQAEIPKLLTRLAPIDQTLRLRGVPRFSSVDAPCLAHYEKGLNPAETATLRFLLSR